MSELRGEVAHTYSDWYDRIMSYERSFKLWEARVDKILKRYKDDSRNKTNPNARFNILWSNVQTITPAIFARLPRPDVSRRFRDNDPIARVASTILERALEFEIEHYGDYKSAMVNAVTDRLLGGRGTCWVRYEPHFMAKAEKEPEDGYELTSTIDAKQVHDPSYVEGQGDVGKAMEGPMPEEEDNEPGEVVEEIEYECCPVDYVHWRDFGHTVARTWEEVTAVWRKVYLNRTALVERFGEELGWKIPLDTKPEQTGKSYTKNDDEAYQAMIYEIWDKETGKVLWISKSLGRILDERDDPLELENFWPCPKPLYATLTTDSLEPIPDFTIYQDQARELDDLCDRIDGLIGALKVRGLYDASASELQRLFSEGNESNVLIPVKNWQAFAEKQGMKGALDLVDIAPFAVALQQCYQAMEQVKAQIYELMGIADIQRGQTDPNETLGAQIIKSNNAAGRLKTMQHAVVDFATSLLAIKSQIICQHFTDDTILKISGAKQLSPQDQQLIPQALELLKDEVSKNFRIEVTTDSMIFQDEMQEKQDRMEFLQAMGGFMQQAVPAAASSPELAPLLMEMLKFAATAFKAGKGLEGLIDDTADKLRQQAKAQEGQPKPLPIELQKVQMQQQAEMQKLQLENQLEMQKMQAQNELEKAKQEYQAQENQLKFQLEAARNDAEMQMEAKLAQMKMNMERNTQVLLAHINNGAKIEVARISAADDDGQTAYMHEEDMAKSMEHPLAPLADAIKESNQQMVGQISALVDTINQNQNRPKQVVRGPDGKIQGVI
jgi:hypothetical protein